MRSVRFLAIGGLLGLLTACASADADLAASNPAGPEVLAAEDAVQLLDERADAVVIDVRTPLEFAQGHLTGAALIDIGAADFTGRVGELDPDETYVIYCRTGNRSADAVRIMAELGFASLYDAGGFADLARAGAPTSTP